jgi:hypothetical protein
MSGVLQRGDPWARPDGANDETVRACGTLGEGLERLERARGHLYAFHQLVGRADLLFGEAAEQLGDAGHDALADLVRNEVVGRNVLHGRWSFQVVEEFDDDYYRCVVGVEADVRNALLGGRRHVHEAEMKERRRTHGHTHHERRPGDG